MPAGSERVLFDTSVYVEALRRGGKSTAAETLRRHVSRTYLASVVAGELRAGVRTEAHREALARLTGPFYEADRLVTPDTDAWLQAGDGLAAIARDTPALRNQVSRLWNDALVIVSAQRIGADVVTDNVDDFLLLQRYLGGTVTPFAP